MLKTYREDCAMFKRMEVAEQVYKGGTSYKKPARAESKRGVHVRKRKGGEYTSPKNPRKGRSGKLKTKLRAIWLILPPDQKYVLVAWPWTLLRGLYITKNLL